jgi:hypothetical protein
MKTKIKILLALLPIISTSCIETMDLPTASSDTPSGISEDKDAWVEITPRWRFSDLGVQDISDIASASDGRLYLADPFSGQIAVVRASGEQESGVYDNLKTLSVNGRNLFPRAVAVDGRYITYFTNWTDTVFAWFQYLNMEGVEGVVTSFDYRVGDEIITEDPYIGEFNTDYERLEHSEVLNTDPNLIDSLLHIVPIYISGAQENRIATIDPADGDILGNNPIYANMPKSFTAIADEKTDTRHIAVIDSLNNRLVNFKLVPTYLLKLNNGLFLWHFKGVYDNVLATDGTGAGTLSRPVSLYSDAGGNLLYTQFGDYFGFHKLRAGSYTSAFNYGIDEIMDLDRFKAPMDAVTGDDGSIFVLDSSLNAVLKFSATGDFQKFVAIREEWIKRTDTTWVNQEMVLKDTLVQILFHDLMHSPRALSFYKEVLYVSDNGNQRILRFKRTESSIEDANPYD